MSEKQRLPALAGWHTMDASPQLLGSCCDDCGSYAFPPQSGFCGNPDCNSESFTETPLSRTGHIWSYTDAHYTPPTPYVAADPFVPFAIAAVTLEKEQMTVLGQVVSGVGVDDLKIGMAVELVLETLHETDDTDTVTWKWRPLTDAPVASTNTAEHSE